MCTNTGWLLVGALLALPSSASVAAESFRELLKDPQDGRLDASRWLLDRRGFLPVPVIITEPAVGYGGGIALAFFHRPDAPAATTPREKPEMAPPSVSGVMAAATENGTKMAGLGHLGIWRHDTLRYTGGIGAMDINLRFYGGSDFPRLSDGVEYNMKGWGTLQQLVWRIGKSDIWIGPQLVYMDVSTRLDQATPLPAFDSLEGSIENLGAGLALQYDSRDNIFTPNRGLQSEWVVREHWGEFINDFQYTEIDGKNRGFLNPHEKWVIGLRLDMSFTGDGTPFYALPFINQRGIAKSRYQGEAVFSAEMETRYDIDGRWFAVAFAGAGRAADSFSDLGNEKSRWAGGLGARYLIARMLGLQVGIDVAKGPEEWAFYLQVGSGWGM